MPWPMMRVEASMVMICWWVGRDWEDPGVGAAVVAAAADPVGNGTNGLGPFGVVGPVEWRKWRSWRRF